MDKQTRCLTSLQGASTQDDVDSSFRYTGLTLVDLRATTRRKQAIRGVVAIIERGGRILMQKRCEHIADPGMWMLPGGRMLHGEEPSGTLVRVCAEEFGATVRPSRLMGILEVGAEQFPVWHVLWKGKELRLGNEQIAGIGWFTMDELLTLEPVRHQQEFRDFLRSEAFLGKMSNIAAMENAPGEVRPEHGETKEKEGITDEELFSFVRRAQEGDHEAFGVLYDHFVTPIYRYVVFRVPEAVAEDLVADVFVKAWEKLHTYKVQKSTPFSSWLFRIARNVVIDAYRTQRDTQEIDEFHEDEDRWNDPTLALTQTLQCTLVRQAMGKLPRRYREVLLLSFMSDLSHGEIALAMRMREGSVRILKHRALRKLSTLLPASMREELP